MLRVVILEDSAGDARLAELELKRSGLSCHSLRVETREDFVGALEGFKPDVILADFALPQFDGMEALETAKRLAPATPFVVVTGWLDDVQAVSLLSAGADDFVLKDRLARLGPAVRTAIESRRVRSESEAAILSLRESEERYRRLFELESDAILLADNSTGQVLEVNAAATKLYGYSKVEWLGMRFWDVSTEPEKTQLVARQRLTWIPVRWHRRKNGETFPVEVTCSHFEWRGRSVHVAAIRDVSERVRAEEELTKSRGRLLEAQRIAQVGSWRYTLANQTMEWSAETARIFGVGLGEPTPGHEDVVALIHPEDRGRFDEFTRTGVAGGEVAETELRVVRRDGTVRHVVVRGEGEPGPDGRVFALYGTAQDVTERRKGQQLQAALLEVSEAARTTQGVAQLFSALHVIVGRLLPAANFHIALHNQTTGLLEFPYFVEETGATAEPIRPGSGLTGAVLRTGQPVLVSGPPLAEMERRGEAVREGRVPVSWLGVPLKVGGAVIGAMVLQAFAGARFYTEEDRDLLGVVASAAAQAIERKRTEERLELMHGRLEIAARAGRLGVWDWDVRRNEVVWDARMCELYGLARDGLVGAYADWVKLIHPEDVPMVNGRVRLALRGTREFDVEFRIVRPDGTVRYVRAYAQVVRDPKGSPLRMAGVNYDTTERRRLEEQLRQSQKMEAIGNLAGGVAHDFNNLLQAMLSLVEALRVGRNEPEAAAAQLAGLEDHIRRGAQLTRQLLIFSRREITSPETMDLNETAGAAGQMLRRLLRENITLEFELSPAEVRVQADRGQVEQVLMNLALNASDAMPFGGKLVVRTGREGSEAWIEVQDTGEGIPEAIRARIFDPFFTTKPPGKGTGLGLSVVHGIVTSHGGAIRVDSEVGKGTTIRITLHAARGGVSHQSPGPGPGREYVPGRGERVLVVEDETGAREGLQEILGVLGYEAQIAASAEEACDLEADGGFDVLLTDMMLPGLSGVELADRLRERWPRLRVILMSGYTDEDLVRQGVEAGDLRFLQKPFDMATLARVVRETLDDGSRVADESPAPV